MLTDTLDDFTKLDQLLQRFIDYERGGAVAMLQKTWRMVFAEKDITKARSSLQKSKETLTVMMLLTSQ